MSLQAKVVLIVLTVVSLYALLDYAGQHVFVLRSFVSLERNQAQNTMRCCVAAIKRDISKLREDSEKWTASQDIQELVAEQRHADRAGNLATDFLAQNGLNSVCIYDAEGQIIAHRTYDSRTQNKDQFQPLLPDAWLPAHAMLDQRAPSSCVGGILMTRQGPMTVAAQPITSNRNNERAQGTLLVGKFVDNRTLSKILTEQTDAQLEIKTTADAPLPDNERAAVHQLEQGSQFYVSEQSQKLLSVYTLLPGIRGAPALLVRADVPRNIRSKAIAALVRSNLLSNLAGGLLVALALLLLLSRTVVTPIRRLTSSMKAVAGNHVVSAPRMADRRDEIGTLAREFHHMVEQLAESRKRVFEQSYRLGKAEVASGVLHNSRNLLTPLVSRIAGLRQRLAEVPIEELTIAETELSQTAPACERGRNLSEFVHLANKRLVELLEATKEKLGSIAKLVEQVEQMLDKQGRHSRTELPWEETTLHNLVREAVALQPNELRESISIEVDPSVERLEPIRIQSITLLQVLYNLLMNGAESIRRAGVINGRIHIRAEAECVNGVPMAHIQIADNGEGIEPCKLRQVFERGFSTKNIPSGIGLHWCANTVAEMNGHIYAESEGTGRGATFNVLLPIFDRKTGTSVEKAGAKA